MDINELMDILIKYKNGTNSLADNTFEPDPSQFENEYISMGTFNSSNVKVGGPKQWNIIYISKSSYEHLSKFQQLKNNGEIRVAITKYKAQTRKELEDCNQGLRLYDMVSEPDKKLLI